MQNRLAVSLYRTGLTRAGVFQIVRFAIVGAARTAVSLGLYLILMIVAPYWIAFTLAFIVTVTFAAIANGKYVFFVKLSWCTYFLYMGAYVVSYLASLILLVTAVELIGIPPVFAPVPVVICLFPFNFLAERYVLQSKSEPLHPVP